MGKDHAWSSSQHWLPLTCQEAEPGYLNSLLILSKKSPSWALIPLPAGSKSHVPSPLAFQLVCGFSLHYKAGGFSFYYKAELSTERVGLAQLIVC